MTQLRNKLLRSAPFVFQTSQSLRKDPNNQITFLYNSKANRDKTQGTLRAFLDTQVHEDPYRWRPLCETTQEVQQPKLVFPWHAVCVQRQQPPDWHHCYSDVAQQHEL